MPGRAAVSRPSVFVAGSCPWRARGGTGQGGCRCGWRPRQPAGGSGDAGRASAPWVVRPGLTDGQAPALRVTQLLRRPRRRVFRPVSNRPRPGRRRACMTAGPDRRRVVACPGRRGRCLDSRSAIRVALQSAVCGAHSCPAPEGKPDEAHVQAAEPETCEQARIPGPDEDPGGAPGPGAPPPPRSSPPFGEGGREVVGTGGFLSSRRHPRPT